MSYINDALRKAQKERDGRYGQLGGIITPGPKRPAEPRKRTFVVSAAVILLVMASAGLIFWVGVMQQPLPVKKGSPESAAAGSPAASEQLAPQAAGNAGPESASTIVKPEGSQTVKTEARPGGAPAAIQKGEKPAPQETEVWYKEALNAQRKGDLREAKGLYRKVLKSDPGHVKALNNLGVIYMGQRMRGKAIAAFNRSIVLKKDYVDPYYNLACLYAQTHEIDESLWYLNVAMSINADVKKWAEKDADLKNIASSLAFKKIMEGRNN